MMVNPSIRKQSFTDSISLKKLIFSIITLTVIYYQFAIINNFGATSSWGTNTISMVFFGIQINNVQLFFVLALLGNILILVSSFKSIFGINLDDTNKVPLNEKQIHSIGFFLYFIGILGYFNFLLLEPFMYLYLVFMGVAFYNLVTLNFSPFYQAGYRAFSALDDGSNVIMNFSVWHPNTKEVIGNYFNSQGTVLDIFLVLSVFLLFVQGISAINTKGRLISENHSVEFQKFFKKNYLIATNSVENKLLVLVPMIAIIDVAYIITFLNPLFVISFIIAFFYFPFSKRSVLTTELFKLGSFPIKIYDVYIANLIVLLVIGLLLELYSNINLIVLLILSFWITFHIIDFYRSKRRTFKESTVININFNTLVSFLFSSIIIFYVNAWITSDESEGFFLFLLIWGLVFRYSPFIIRNFLNSGVIKFSLRRFSIIIPMFVGISIIVFGLMSITGNPIDILLQAMRCPPDAPQCVAEYRAILEDRFGLTKPLYVQWANWILRFLMGDFGQEIVIGGAAVSKTMMSRIIPTMEISFIPLIFSLLISIPLGITASKKQNSLTDNSILVFVAIGIAVPIFFFLLVMILILSNMLSILPSTGRRLEADIQNVNLAYTEWFHDGFQINIIIDGKTIFKTEYIHFDKIIAWDKYDWLFHVAIPILAITILSLALYTRLVRGSMLEIMRQDYILSARASGFSEKVIVNKHALRNVLIPVITILGLSVGSILGGAPITETVTGWPGLGKYGLVGLLASDYPVIMATYMVVSFMVLTANLLTDITYSVIDPRVRIE